MKKVPDKKLILLIGLSIFAVFSLLYGIMTPSKAKRGNSSSVELSPKASTIPLSGSSFSERRTQRSVYALWGRNPFLLREAGPQQTAGLTLNGIAWDEKSPRAVINDRIVGAGDKIEGMEIIRVEPERVILSDGLNEFELRLGRQK